MIPGDSRNCSGSVAYGASVHSVIVRLLNHVDFVELVTVEVNIDILYDFTVQKGLESQLLKCRIPRSLKMV